ncbi:hypothetical protein NPS58_13710 [Pseudomonas putida]|uniref:hypothetical protein n=1 Tax=Pseudomonas putida TaxID=303 RepID=UPI002364494B|nr:hypothetical protein [Pseudomonas putida]MDD2058481.1 hypothetical protein [Pseudomonas putida]
MYEAHRLQAAMKAMHRPLPTISGRCTPLVPVGRQDPDAGFISNFNVAKLGVKRRTLAVMRAKEMGLLSP